MGLLDLFNKQSINQVPTLQTRLPDVVKKELLIGRLPILKTNTLFLKNGEVCHYMDNAIFEKRKVKNRYVRRNAGYSMPGLFKGNRIHFGGGNTDVVDNVTYEHLNGTLYITNKRIVFVGEECGFDKNISKISALTPYSNCIKLQFDNDTTYTVFIPDGNVVNMVLQLVK